jgi:hypothetical protein
MPDNHSNVSWQSDYAIPIKPMELAISSGMLAVNDNSGTSPNASDIRRRILDVEATVKMPGAHKELTQQGTVKWKVYGDFAKASNLFGVALYIIALIGAQIVEIGEYIRSTHSTVYLQSAKQTLIVVREQCLVKKMVGSGRRPQH